MKLREKLNLKSLKEPEFGEDDEDESMAASEQDDENYSGSETSTDEDDPEEDYRHFAHSDMPTLMQQAAKSDKKKRVATTTKKAAAPPKKSKKTSLSSSNLKKSEYFNDENENESSQDVPFLKVKKKGATSKPKPKNGLKSVENNVDDLLSSEMEPKKNSKSSKSNPKPKKQTKPKKKTKEEENEDDDSSEEDDWEEVRMEHHVNVSAIGLNPIEVVINNDNKRNKSSKSSDPRAKYERMLKALRKKFSIAALKTHLLCWLAHGLYLNRLCLDDQHLAALVLSYSHEIDSSKEPLRTSKLDARALKSYLQKANNILVGSSDDVDRLVESGGGTDPITSESMHEAVGQRKFTTYLQYVLVIAVLLRSQGVKIRLCVCFHVIDPKSFSENVSKKTVRVKNVDKNNNKNDSSDDVEEISDSENSKSHRPLFKNKPTKKNNMILSNEEEDTDSKDSFEQKWNSSRFYWLEVYLEREHRWCAIEPLSARTSDDCAEHLEQRFGQRVLYVCAFDDDNRVKDVTKRYASEWTTKTRLARVSHLEEKKLWWERTLLYLQPYDVQRDIEEEKQLKEALLKQPLPSSVAEFKDHPLYVLPRHLLKFQAIYPADAVPVTHVRDEPVYSRDNLVTLHSRQTWLKFARVVKPFEKPYKMVKGRIKQSEYKQGVRENPELDLYGYWQTKEFEPPYAENGRIPRNEFGNVELFRPQMIPHGCVHLRGMPNLNRLCRKLKLDCAAAVVGFDAHGGFSHAVYDGWVVCVEHRDLIVDAYRQEEIESRKRAIEKNKERVLGNWKKLIQGVLIRERLKAKYDDKKKLTNKMLEEMGTAITAANEEAAASKSSVKKPVKKHAQDHDVEMKEAVKSFSGDQEVVGAKLNCVDAGKKEEEFKSIISLNRDEVPKSSSLSARAAATVATRTTRASSKRSQPKQIKSEIKIENKKSSSKKSKNINNYQEDMEEADCDDPASAEDDEEYKPERKKRTSRGQRRPRGRTQPAKTSKSSSESSSEDDEPPIKRSAKMKQLEPAPPPPQPLVVESTDSAKPSKIYKYEDDGELKLSESDEE